MKVIVAASEVTAEDADDLNALSVELRCVSAHDAARALDGYGRLDGAHVWLRIEKLRSLAPIPRPCSWDARFARTMAYAQSKGWTDETGTFVRAHIGS